MTEEQLRETAAQLRQPHGDGALMIAEFMNKGNARMNEDTLKAVTPSPEDNILEVGMGNGYFVKDILSIDSSIHYTGVDLSEEMVKEAERINSAYIHEGKAVFVHADVSSLPLDNELYTKAFTVNTIYFWEDPGKILAELRRVLMPGGKLIIALRPKHRMVHYPFTKYGFNMFSKEDVRALLEANGFTVTDIQENQEPDFDMNGQKMPVENVVVVGEKK